MRIHISILLVFFTTIVFSQDLKFSKEILNNPKENSDSLEAKFNINEIRVFDRNKAQNQIVLENGYVKSKILNPDVWQKNKKDIIVTQIDIVFLTKRHYK